MADLKGRIAALEQRQRDEQREFRSASARRWIHPEEAAEAYRQWSNPVTAPTADEVRWRQRWHLLTATEASNLYAELMRNPRFDIDKALAQAVAGRSEAPSTGIGL